ncbi:MAG: NAD(+)/NADH kinase [Acidimicrobiia bacterium]|nr:NAD(+)/NADH kinase [Acidimicrobiia bacterium]
MKLAMVVHPDRSEAKELAEQLRAQAALHSIEVVDELSADLDGVIAVGGDGTMLEALKQAMPLGLAVAGVNMGHVGYMAAVPPERIVEAVERIAAGETSIEERLTVTAKWSGGVLTGVNDIVLEKIESQHAVRLQVDIDGERLVTYRADGVIVATPTGSTAYAFSAGGPIVPSGLDALVLTAVAAHNLFSRPVVLPADTTIRFEVSGHRSARVNVDGRECAVLSPGSELVVTRGETVARFLRVFPAGFAATLRNKFHIED